MPISSDTHGKKITASKQNWKDKKKLGAEAYKNGIPHNKNPYKSSSINHTAWSSGWLDAEMVNSDT